MGPPSIQERLGEKRVECAARSLQCPSCSKHFNVRRYKAGTKVLCKGCGAPLVPLATAANVPVSDTGAGELRQAPAGKEVDPSLADLIPGYRIERRLGSGGMGDVYLARQLSLDRLVAIKLLPPELAREPGYVERFLREAKSAAKVTHENIIAAVDAGEAGGRYYFVMEHVDGETVSQVIQREGALEEAAALRIALQVARGLRHAHRQGLIHRDIKPSNVMLAVDGTAKICDFGLARSARELDMAAAGLVQASPAYASPEQCRGRKDVDHRSDMYSLGVTLFEMLTGRKPFEGATPNELFIKHVTEAPPAPRSLRGTVSPGANQLVLRLMRKQPSARYESYDQLVEAIERLLQPRPAAAARAGAPAAAPAAVPLWERPAFLGAAAGAGLLVILLAAVLAGGGGGAKEAPAGGEKAAAPEAAGAKPPPEVERAISEAKALEEHARGSPLQYPVVRANWRRLEERLRGTPHHPAVASLLVQFEGWVDQEAEKAAIRAFDEAAVKEAGGRLAEAVQALRGFSAGYAGTEAAGRVEARLAALERALEERYSSGKDEFFTLISRERWDEAARRLERLREEVTVSGEYVRPQHREELDKLARRLEEERLLAKKRREEATSVPVPVPPPATDPGPPVPVPPVPVPPPPAPAPSSAPSAESLEVLRSAALRVDLGRRAAAAAVFSRVASRSPLWRAAEVFLACDERAWGLEHDRLTVKTENVTYENLDGQARGGEGGSTVFQGAGGVRVVILKDGRVSIGGGSFVKAVKVEIQRGLRHSLVEALDKYLGALPLEKADSMGAAEHQGALGELGKKISAAGDGPVEALQLFACAHIEALLVAGQKPEPAAARAARLQAAKWGDLWGPPAELPKVILAQQLAEAKSALDLRRAVEAASGTPDVGTRLLAALTAFAGDEFDPRAVTEAFRKLWVQAKGTPIGEFCDQVIRQTKDAHWCADCKGEGRVLCKKCGGAAMAPCDNCNGTGSVTDEEEYPIPCRVCKQKKKVICPACRGGRYTACPACNGAKVRKTIPTGEYKAFLTAHICKRCDGTGAAFARTPFPCPLCDGLGRFPKR